MAKNKKKKSSPQKQQELSPARYIQTKARNLPIVECLIEDKWNEAGLTYVIVTRQHTSGHYTVGCYLVDTFCRGVKDTFYHFNIDEDKYDELKELISSHAVSMINVSYNEVHNIIYGAIAYADDYGLKPHSDFKITQYLLEEDTDDIPLIEYEFGRNGKPCLIAKSNLEASSFLPALQKYAGDDYDVEILDFDDDFDEEWNDELDDEDEDSDNLFLGAPEKFNDMQKNRAMLPNVVYSYQYPAYPSELNLNHPTELQDFFNPKYNYSLPEDCIDTILALPRESLIADLKQIILYEIGRTYDKVEEEDWNEEFVAVLLHPLFFIAELKAEECLDEVLEILRQTLEFFDYHFTDAGEMDVLPALYEAGNKHLQKLADFIQEPGLNTLNKGNVYSIVQQIAYHQPERHEEIIAWFRNQLNLCITSGDDTWYDTDLGASLCSALIDMHAEELLPEIKKLFETREVDTLFCGDYEEVKDFILSDEEAEITVDLKSVYERYREYSDLYKIE